MHQSWQKLAALAIVILLCLMTVKDFIIKSAITTVGSNIVGAPIEIDSFSFSLFTQKVQVKNFKLYNPPGFPNEPMVIIPEIRVDYDVFALMQGKIHSRLVIFNLKEMVVIKNKEGKLNVDSLKIVEEQKIAAEQKKKEKKEGKVSESKEKSKEMSLQIDLLKLNVERVVFKDLTKEPMAVQGYEVALKGKQFKDIKSVQQMITLIMFQAMAPTAIQSAGMYAAATVLGVGFLPAGVVGVIVAKDDASAEFKESLAKVYDEALKSVKQMGSVKSEDKTSGIVKGKVNGVDITIKLENIANKKVKATVSARQLVLPKPEVAAGIIYQLKQKLK